MSYLMTMEIRANDNKLGLEKQSLYQDCEMQFDIMGGQIWSPDHFSVMGLAFLKRR